MSEQELELPKGWAKTTIDNMILQDGLFKDGDWVETKDQDPNGKVRLTQLADIKKFEFRIKSNRFMNKTTAEKLDCTFLKKNDILVARMPDPLGRACIFPGSEVSCVTVVDVAIIRTGDNGIFPNWLMWIINSPQIHSIIEQNQTGTTRKRISRKNLSKINFLLPPLNEQKRIVSKIEELFSKIDSTKQSLEHVKLQLEQYRFSLLKSVFEGKKLVKTGEVCEGVVPGRYKPQIFDGNIPWITTPDLDGLYISNSKKNLCVSREEVKKVRMKIMPKQTVLLTCVGDLGRICITKNEVVPNQQFHGFICTEKILPKYLAYALTIQIRQMFSASTSTTISYMNKTTCNNLKIPLASSIEEQEQIVSKIEQGFSLIENTQNIVNSTLQTLQTMKMSMLKQAFEGKLVPQDPNDEPAHILLEKIKNTKEAKPTKKRRAKNVK